MASQAPKMRAWQYTTVSGGLETNLRLVQDAPQPVPGPSDVLVKVHSMSPNPADFKFPEGLGFLWRLAVTLPAAPGSDFAGTVAAVGARVEDVSVGQRVFGCTKMGGRWGTLAEYVVATRDGCVPVPDGVSMEHACCLGVAAQTAYQSIAPFVAAGDVVLINGGSGGVGTFGIQVAKALGCRVVTTCSTRNVELCKSLGADEVLDYTTVGVSEALRRKGQVFKLAVDNVGAEPYDLYKAADDYLRKDGRFVQVGAGLGMRDVVSMVSRATWPACLGGGRRKWQFLGLQSKHEDLAKLAQWVKEGKVKAVIEETVRYDDAPKAYEKMRTGRTRGCLVVKHEPK